MLVTVPWGIGFCTSSVERIIILVQQNIVFVPFITAFTNRKCQTFMDAEEYNVNIDVGFQMY